MMRRVIALQIGFTLASLLTVRFAVSQTPVTLELDSAAGLLISSPSGYRQASYTFGTVPSGSLSNGKGITVVLSEGEGFVLYGPAISSSTGVVHIQCSVWTSASDVFLAVAGLNSPIDGSLAANMPANGSKFLGGWHVLDVFYDPDNDSVVPLVQAVSTGSLTTVVYIDRIVITPLGASSEGIVETMRTIQTTPRPTATRTPTPTGTTIPSNQTITINIPRMPDTAIPLEMVFIPAGTFMMGSPEGEQGRDSDEGPQHQVTISKPFYLGKYEITQTQWLALMGTNPSQSPGDNKPVENVSWEDCQRFIEQLNTLGQGAFRLPTEAEWEYTCRAGTEFPFWFGYALDCTDGSANCSIFSANMWYSGNSNNQTHVVGSRSSNPWGLFDMYGNVLEWCLDWYSVYQAAIQSNPEGPDSGELRISRGGGYKSNARSECRSASRHHRNPTERDTEFGFRVYRYYDSDYIPPTLTVTPKITPTFTPTVTLTPTPTLKPTVTSTPPYTIISLPTIRIDISNLPDSAKSLEMVLIPAGTFMIGSPDTEPNHISNEGPQHQVTISKPFYLGKYEVTQAQWTAVMGNNPSRSQGINNPVENVSWNDCQAFVETLNTFGQGIFRLPSEAEWEYACRSGTSTAFYWGEDSRNSQIEQYAWYSDNSFKSSHEVGTKLPNPWGLFDMSGNVWEWCRDIYGSYSSSLQIDPVGPSTGSYNIQRGGGWGDFAQYCRSAKRYYNMPGVNHGGVFGFRLVREYP